MEIKPAFNSALLGIQRGMDGLGRDAQQVADSVKDPEQAAPTEALVDSKVNVLQVEANVRMARAVDETLGSLLDEKA